MLNSILTKFINKKKERKRIMIEYRHVKAHEHTNNARHFVNDICDKEAKKQMKIVLKRIGNG